ncbi:unnamed protein product, partial [Pocillopora meandrina]
DESTNDQVQAPEQTQLLSTLKRKRKSSYHCCVPQCNGNFQYHEELITSSRRVCSRHFLEVDYLPSDNAG